MVQKRQCLCLAANSDWFLPPNKGMYSVQSTGGLSPAYAYAYAYASGSFTLAGYVFYELFRPVADATVRHESFTSTTDVNGRFVLATAKRQPDPSFPIVVSVEKDGYWRNASRQYLQAQTQTETQIMLRKQLVTNRLNAAKGG